MMQCLLVTGDRVARDVIKTGLDQTQAVDVEIVTDGWGLEMAKERAFGLVIADTALGDGSDGIEFLRQVRALQPDAELWLITRGKNQARFFAKERAEIGISTLINMPVTAVDFFRAAKKTLDNAPAGAPTPESEVAAQPTAQPTA